MKVKDVFEEESLDLGAEYEQDDDTILYIGVVGSQETDVSEDVLFELIDDILDEIVDEFIVDGDFEEIALVAKPLDSGVRKVAFKIAEERGYTTIGLVNSDEEVPSYPTDVIDIDDGEDHDFFIDYIDVLIQIGSDSDTSEIVEMAEAEDIPVFEEDI